MEVIRWIGEHSNKVRSAIWQGLLVSIAFGWITIEEAQLAVVGMFLDAMLGLFVETNTVSKVRVGERITTEVNKQTGGTGPAAGPGNGTGTGLSILLAVTLAAAGFACASSPKPRLVTTYQAVEIGLGAVQDSEMAVYQSGTLPTLTKEKHQEISRLFVRAFDAQIKFGHALKIWEPGTALPNGYAEWVVSVENVVNALNELLPQQDSLATATVQWVRNVIAIIRTFGQIVPPPIAAVIR